MFIHISPMFVLCIMLPMLILHFYGNFFISSFSIFSRSCQLSLQEEEMVRCHVTLWSRLCTSVMLTFESFLDITLVSSISIYDT